MKHTKGPWKVREWKDGDRNPGNKIYDSEGFEIASLSYTGGSEDQDAQLIASAPELLEALIRLLSLCELEDRHGRLVIKDNEKENAKNAIAKAKEEK